MPEAEKWIGKRVFDCAGLVTAALSSFLGLKVISGASSQWKGDYWDLKGTIDTLPKDYVVILYRESPSSNPMRHTGIYTANGRFVDARGTKSGVVSGAIESYPWTHWALPKGMLSDTELNTLKAELGIQDSAQDKETGGGNMEIKAGSIAQVAGNRLALRREMAVNAKNLIRRLDTGTNVKVISVPNAEWCEVEVGNNRGYVMSKFLQPTASAPVDIGDANKISNKPHTIHISCESKEEADRVLQLLKTAAIS